MMKILLVDDHEVVRRGLRDILTKEFKHAHIVEAQDSVAAFGHLEREPWDLVLLDVNMPGRSGLDLLHDTKQLRPQTPVLVLSVYPEEEFALRALKLGASAYLNKQSASAELLAAIRKIMSGGKYLTTTMAQNMADQLGEDFKHEPHEALSTRELEVLRMVAMGKTLKEIAAELALGDKTIGTYRSRIAEKMGLSSNVELTRYALQHKLVD